jgi:hypothetical protein
MATAITRPGPFPVPRPLVTTICGLPIVGPTTFPTGAVATPGPSTVTTIIPSYPLTVLALMVASVNRSLTVFASFFALLVIQATLFEPLPACTVPFHTRIILFLTV